MPASCAAAAVWAEQGSQPRVSAPSSSRFAARGRLGNSGGHSSLSAAMHWVCGVEVSTDMPRFAEADQQMWVSPLLVRDKTAGCCTGFCTALAQWSSVTRRECFEAIASVLPIQSQTT